MPTFTRSIEIFLSTLTVKEISWKNGEWQTASEQERHRGQRQDARVRKEGPMSSVESGDFTQVWMN